MRRDECDIFLLQTHGPYYEHNQIKQEHKKWLVIARYRLGGSTQSTLKRAKALAMPHETSLDADYCCKYRAPNPWEIL